MVKLSTQRNKMQIKPSEPEKDAKIYQTSENSPELKEKMDKISAELLKRNKNLYRRLANAC